MLDAVNRPGGEDVRRAGLPGAAELARLLSAEGIGLGVSAVLERVLVAPARDIVERPSKQFRARLVRLAHGVAARGAAAEGDAGARLARCAEVIELLHAGSLIVDDIQDGSGVRRGGKSVHERYGVGPALCAGNWLYFWPLRLLGELGLSAEAEREAFRVYHEAVEKAHYGQAIDLNLKTNQLAQDELPSVCRAVLELKTGAITALAMALGALVAGADAHGVQAMQAFGRSFGCALQMLDDLGNLVGGVDPEKRFEDVVQRKPTGVWGFAARTMTVARFARFREAALALPSGADELVAELKADGFLAAAAAEARAELDAAFQALAAYWDVPPDAPALSDLRQLAERLLHAYE